jgi:hypothetical protein
MLLSTYQCQFSKIYVWQARPGQVDELSRWAGQGQRWAPQNGWRLQRPEKNSTLSSACLKIRGENVFYGLIHSIYTYFFFSALWGAAHRPNPPRPGLGRARVE